MELSDNAVLAAGKKIARALLLDAIKNDASDLHLEPDLFGMKVRYRVNGSMQDVMDLPPLYQAAVIGSLKKEAHMDMLLTEAPQEGKIRLPAGGEEHLFIASSLPVIYGERMVMHLVKHRHLEQAFRELGFSSSEEATLHMMIDMPMGLIVICGSLGNGRSTTALNMLRKLREKGRDCVSVEQALTYEARGITQIPLSMEDLCGRMQESLSSLNPEVLLLDELLNSLSLQLLISQLAGDRLVLAVTRSKSAPGAIRDLMAMGMPGSLLSTHLIGVLHQKLARLICPHCRQPHELETTGEELLEILPEGPFFRGTGCPACRQNGSMGRMLVAQVLTANDSLRKHLAAGDRSCDWGSFAHPADLHQHLLDLAHEGTISLEEMRRISS